MDEYINKEGLAEFQKWIEKLDEKIKPIWEIETKEEKIIK